MTVVTVYKEINYHHSGTRFIELLIGSTNLVLPNLFHRTNHRVISKLLYVSCVCTRYNKYHIPLNI